MASISIQPFDERHFPAALRLSREAGWPHGPEDWALSLRLSQGWVALDGDVVVGTALLTPFGPDLGTVNMVIVDAERRGQGIGGRLFRQALAAGDRRSLRLVATPEGQPLYARRGFEARGPIQRHEGLARAPAPTLARLEGHEALDEIAALDALASGGDRRAMLEEILRIGTLATLRREGRLAGFGLRRPFGGRQVIGPVIAPAAEDARDIVCALCAGTEGPLRIDVPADGALAPWLPQIGLPHHGGGLAMRLGPERGEAAALQALASQAFG
ncbi:GNAT family N-acetyltransferase [Pseudoroseicyclus aestuarii]|uniref:Putative N-acetyltransferase YhbS n=1 Tax=Pseudoroseicyclus aestuarii TaxID=1795041 RepID=A0A318SR50_9RHOB|nr:GNAT family N-acetyltransferase [Pseudoroseicyclus aestuarii]PYE84290.1 putative N-acetyltransferase YhbS [Pseudoroseicyclus aestuarii]